MKNTQIFLNTQMFEIVYICVEQVCMQMMFEACVTTCGPISSYGISMLLLLRNAQILTLS